MDGRTRLLLPYLHEGIALASRHRPDQSIDLRALVCRFEDDLFADFPQGHERFASKAEAQEFLDDLFGAMRICGMPRVPPKLRLVMSFDDPRVGGFANVIRHEVVIQEGYLYRFLVMHEAAHIIVPDDRKHNARFLYVLQFFYRQFLGIPEAKMLSHLHRHGLPDHVADPPLPAHALTYA